MTKATKRILIIVCGAIGLFVAPLLLIVGSNLVGGIYSAVFEREPSNKELIGFYKYKANWGSVSLVLKEDHTFEETMLDNKNLKKSFAGTWGSKSDFNFAEVTFRPFGMVWDENHGAETNVFSMDFYKPRFGQTYATINDDLGQKFHKQQTLRED